MIDNLLMDFYSQKNAGFQRQEIDLGSQEIDGTIEKLTSVKKLTCQKSDMGVKKVSVSEKWHVSRNWRLSVKKLTCQKADERQKSDMGVKKLTPRPSKI